MELKESGAFIVPRQVIASSDTRSENVEVSRLLYNAHRALKSFCKKHKLPVTLIIAQPRLGQTMIGRIVTGRGLPSYPTKDAQCAHERKIVPVNSRLRSYYKDIGINQPAKETVLVLGSRTGESLERGKSMSRFNAASHVTYSKESKAFELYPIKHWTVEDVWKLLTFAGSDKGLIPSYVGNFSDIVHFYADATGECVFNHRDTKQSEACSPRTGCFDCVRMKSDKSMEQLIQSDPEKYGYMKSLSKIRDFIWNI